MKLSFRTPRPAAIPLSRQTSHVCHAGKKQGAKKAAKVQVPKTPPQKENAVDSPEHVATEDPVVDIEEEQEAAQVVEEVVQAQAEVQQTMTTEEIAAQMAQLRAASKENKQKEGMVEVCCSFFF